ncbi:MAG: type I polyketide synthase, partial [Chloroflexota bacterium]
MGNIDDNLSTFSEGMTAGQTASSFAAFPKTAKEPIAIIGIGCRFPGASGPEVFWQMLRDGVDALGEIPADRFDISTYFDPRPGKPGKIVTRQGGFLEEIDKFDPYFFGISPREARVMDPQQRLILEVAWEALEDAGLVPGELAGSSTGVFVGMCTTDYGNLQLQYSDARNLDVYSAPGAASSVLTGRLSYVLDLHGPAVTMDTACSSSLIAAHLACQSIWTGESRLALAGGANIILLPEPFMCFSQAGMLAPDGRCKFGDARADGFVRSEGVGLIVLKPLSLAQADGDTIYALIRGSTANNDGHSSGLMMPSFEAQEAVLRAAYRQAGVSPSQIQYIEAHGTGTAVGDPTEMHALGAVLGEGRAEDTPCVVGSVKTNIGHLEGGSGVAGLIKLALALRYQEIPPSLHLEEPNPNISWDELPLVVQRELGPWPAHAGPALGGVNSFGISGTNVHIVLEEPPQAPSDHVALAPAARPHLLPLSAHTLEALSAVVGAYREFTANGAKNGTPSLRDICYSAGVRRTHHDHRLALVVHSKEELAEHLDAFRQDEERPGMSSGARPLEHLPKVAFVFSGQGPKWWPLDQRLLEHEPAFRQTLERCDKLLRRYTQGWTLLEQLTADDEHCRLHETDVLQPALLAVQVALAALWRSWGIEPSAVIGHSVGEVAAGHVSGALSLEDALWIISHRGPIMKQVIGKGRMALVGLTMEQARETLQGYEGRLCVAVSNSPTMSVISGDTDALEEVLAALEQRGVFCRLIPAVDLAAHSPHMEPLKLEIVQALEGLQPSPTSVPMYSTVLGRPIDGLALDATYWGRNLREPVLFSVAMNQLLADGHNVFLEMSPHVVLTRPIQDCLRHADSEGLVIPSLKRGQEGYETILGTAGTLYTRGFPIDWKELNPPGGQYVRLPSYRWQGERYWIETSEAGSGYSFRKSQVQNSRYPILGQRLKSAVHAETHFWEMELNTDSLPCVADHRVQGLVVLPAAAYVDIILSAAEETFGPG